jgi:hypothetical protein
VFHNTGTPYPVQVRANFPYQRLAPDSAVEVAGMVVPAAIAEGTAEEVVVVVEKEILTAVAQLVIAVPLRLMVPVRIASRSSPAAPVPSVAPAAPVPSVAPAALPVPVVAGVVVVLRFPLCLLCAICLYIQNLSDFYLLLFNRSDMKGCGTDVVCPAYHNWVILTRVGVL